MTAILALIYGIWFAILGAALAVVLGWVGIDASPSWLLPLIGGAAGVWFGLFLGRWTR